MEKAQGPESATTVRVEIHRGAAQSSVHLPGCLIEPDRVVTLASDVIEFVHAERAIEWMEVAGLRGRSDGHGRVERRRTIASHADGDRNVAVLELDAPLVLDVRPGRVLAERDPEPGAPCVVESLVSADVAGSGRPSDELALLSRGAVVTGRADVEGRSLLRLRLDRDGDRVAMGGSPVYVEGRLAGIVTTSGADRDFYAIPASQLREALYYFTLASPGLTSHEEPAPTPEFVPQYAESIAKRAHESSEDGGESDASTATDRSALWGRFSSSSRRAFRHAESLRMRDGKRSVHMEHLLLGLYEKREGPTRAELQRAGISDADLRERLERIAERPLPPYVKSEELPELHTLPPVSAHVWQAVESAIKVADGSGAEQVQSRHLLFGALSVRHCGVIRWMYERANPVDPARIDMRGEPSGPDVVARASAAPSPAAPATTVGASTLPSPGAGGLFRLDNDSADGDDLFGITREVNAICDVIAAKGTEPPLSIGLFGDWGTGKSFFMELMNDRVVELKKVARANVDSAYCPNIVQLRFNAWHYMDTDLWASLTAEIFEGLGRALEDDARLRADGVENKTLSPDEARLRLLGETAHLRDVVARAEQQRNEAASALRASQEQTEALLTADRQLEARLTPGEIARAVSRAVAADDSVKKSIGIAVDKLGIPESRAVAADVQATLLGVRGLWGSLRTTWLTLRAGKYRLWVLVSLCILLALILTWRVIEYAPLVGWIARHGLATIASAIALLAPLLAEATRVMKVITDAQAQNAALVEEKRKDEAAALSKRREEIQKRLAEEEVALDRARAQLEAAEKSLRMLSADEKMMQFVRERQESTEYTRHFGVIARARHDFERLSELLDEVAHRKRDRRRNRNVRPPAQVTAGLGVPRIDRIILYVDDLDRCPEEKVVDVLQAVHLLLAFPLFIVVVGVDSRWLLHSLRRHSTAFQADPEVDGDGIDDEEDVHWQSTPFNYLEKIFQIPFNLNPMEERGFTALVDAMTVATVASNGGSVAASTPANARASTPEVASSSTPTTATPRNGDEPSREPKPSQDVVRSVASPQDDSSGTGATPAREKVTPPPATPLSSQPATAEDATPDPTINPRPHFLEISGAERDFMRLMHPLIPTPRAAKRYVNVYRLMRALVADEQRRHLQAQDAASCRHVLLLIAILTGFPREGTTILRELLRPSDQQEGWWAFVDRVVAEKIRDAEQATPRARAGGSVSPRSRRGPTESTLPTDERLRAERWRDLRTRLGRVKQLVATQLDDECPRQAFADWATHVARYSFEAGRVVQAMRAE